MKKIKILSIFFVLLFSLALASCGAKEVDTKETIKEVHKELPTETQIVYSSDPSDYVKTARSEKFGDYKYKIPEILLDSDDARRVNQEISDEYESLFNLGTNGDRSFVCTSLGYKTYFNNQILSVVICAQYVESIEYYSVYNFDVATGVSLTNGALVRKLSLNEDETRKSLKNSLKLDFTERYSEDEGSGEYKEAMKKSLSKNNLKKNCYMFINNEGELYATCKEYSVSSTSSYYFVLVKI